MSKDFVNKLDMNPASVYTITTDEGYVLHASFLPAYDYMDDYGRIENYDYKNPKSHLSDGSFAPKKYHREDGNDNCNGQKFVIISHGYTYNRHGSMKYASILRRLGYNCVIYDDRRHGENEKTVTTLILCCISILIGILSFFSGMILHAITWKNRQDFEMRLVQIADDYKKMFL